MTPPLSPEAPVPAPAVAFPAGFFDRADATDDARFYAAARLVTHLDDGAIAAVGELYDELALGPHVLDVCSSWVSHFRTRPPQLTVLGMNADELAANPAATARVVADLNAEPRVPLPDACVDDAVCCVSVDYLTRPVEVFADLARVVRPGGRFVCTWSDRCFPTKAVRGWLSTSDEQHLQVVTAYFAAAGGWLPAQTATRLPPGGFADPLWACWAVRR